MCISKSNTVGLYILQYLFPTSRVLNCFYTRNNVFGKGLIKKIKYRPLYRIPYPDNSIAAIRAYGSDADADEMIGAGRRPVIPHAAGRHADSRVIKTI